MPQSHRTTVVETQPQPDHGRPRRIRPAAPAVGLAAVATLILSACGGSVSVGTSKTIDLDEVKAAINKQYAAQGAPLTKLDCKDGVELKVGAPITCSAANEKGTILNIEGSVTSTEGSGGRFRVKTVSAAVDGTKIADKTRELLDAKYTDQKVRDLTCPDTIPLPTKPDVTCELTAQDGSKLDVAVTLNAEGDLSIQVADKVKSGPTG